MITRPIPRLAACVSWLFHELPFLDRFEAAKKAGFEGVECHYPYDIPASEVRRATRMAGLDFLGINTAVRQLSSDDTGVGAIPGFEAEARARFDEAFDYITEAGGRAIHVKPGSIDASNEEARACFIAHLQESAKLAERNDIMILIEPLNEIENPDYFLRTNQQASEIIQAVGMSSVRLMFDLYHMTQMGLDIAQEFQSHQDIIGHVQFAQAPGRHEPSARKNNCLQSLLEIHALGYNGWTAAEYRPSGDTVAGLAWMRELANLRASLNGKPLLDSSR
jgi:hydroxypyruvate isomerase